jgi:catechol 2,3-dioxygenase-like lactoylglutathione lyase family enzyme
MASLLKDVRHFGIAVKNMEKSLWFYRDLLGLKMVREMNENGPIIENMLNLNNVNVHTAKLSVDDGVTLVELLEFKSHKEEPSDRQIFDIGASHVAFTVNNLDECYSFLCSKGIKFNSSPQISPDGFAKVCFCYDPDNTPVELVEIIQKNT